MSFKFARHIVKKKLNDKKLKGLRYESAVGFRLLFRVLITNLLLVNVHVAVNPVFDTSSSLVNKIHIHRLGESTTIAES